MIPLHENDQVYGKGHLECFQCMFNATALFLLNTIHPSILQHTRVQSSIYFYINFALRPLELSIMALLYCKREGEVPSLIYN